MYPTGFKIITETEKQKLRSKFLKPDFHSSLSFLSTPTILRSEQQPSSLKGSEEYIPRDQEVQEIGTDMVIKRMSGIGMIIYSYLTNT